MNELRIDVKINLLKDSDFPKKTDEFGYKEVATANNTTRQIPYIEAYLDLLDTVIIVAENFEAHIKELRKKEKEKDLKVA